MPDRDTTTPTMQATVPMATPRPGQVFAGPSSTALDERASTIPGGKRDAAHRDDPQDHREDEPADLRLGFRSRLRSGAQALRRSGAQALRRSGAQALRRSLTHSPAPGVR